MGEAFSLGHQCMTATSCAVRFRLTNLYRGGTLSNRPGQGQRH